jgi:type 1 glutamine amidotransferase
MVPLVIASACGGRAKTVESRNAGDGGASGGVGDAGADSGTGGDPSGGATSGASNAGSGEGGAGPAVGGAGGEGGAGAENAEGGAHAESGAAGVAVGSGGAAGGSGEAGSGAGGRPASDAYAPRSGPFNVLVYPRTRGWQSPDANAAGEAMLAELAAEYGFELTIAEDEAEFTLENLERHELVVFLNTSGDVLDEAGQLAFEEWMTTKNGAFLGTHRAGDTERDWAFYHELLGEYYDGQTFCCPEVPVEWQTDVGGFPVNGLPSPWRVGELWLFFEDFREWSRKPGFKILGTVDLTGIVSEASENTIAPVSFVREWATFRSFYTAFGFRPESFEDANVKRHVAAGLLWTVRREHWLEAGAPQ